MKKLVLLLLMLPFGVFAQEMTNEKLNTIYSTVSDSIEGDNGNWRFSINNVVILSLTDTKNNRMRIISPIMESDKLDDHLIKAALIANFHTALDVKYAVSDGVLWSVFIHPLKELSAKQVNDAVSQVYHANINFGTTYASTSLTFPINTEVRKVKKKEKQKIKKF